MTGATILTLAILLVTSVLLNADRSARGPEAEIGRQNALSGPQRRGGQRAADYCTEASS